MFTIVLETDFCLCLLAEVTFSSFQMRYDERNAFVILRKAVTYICATQERKLKQFMVNLIFIQSKT